MRTSFSMFGRLSSVRVTIAICCWMFGCTVKPRISGFRIESVSTNTRAEASYLSGIMHQGDRARDGADPGDGEAPPAPLPHAAKRGRELSQQFVHEKIPGSARRPRTQATPARSPARTSSAE